MRVLSILSVFLCLVVPQLLQARAFPEVIEWNGERILLPSCLEFDHSFAECLKLRAARQRVEAETLGTFAEMRGSKLQHFREFALAAYDKRDGMHVIRLAMPIEFQSDFQPLVLTPSEPPYVVERVRGSSLNKMVYRVRQGEEVLQVYMGRYLLVDRSEKNGAYRNRLHEIHPVTYLATPPYLVHGKLPAVGEQFLRRIGDAAVASLCLKGVKSRAFPGKLICEVYTGDDVAAIVAVEQTDPCLLRSRSAICAQLIPEQPYASDEQVLESVYTQFALTGDLSYAYLGSSQGALGACQFTNRPFTPRGIGTYDLVRRSYPEAMLEPDFVRGSRNLLNCKEAGVLLLDLEMENTHIAPWIKTAFYGGDRIGLFAVGASYNGGASEAKKMSVLAERFRKERGNPLRSNTGECNAFVEWVQEKGSKTLKRETHGYVGKLGRHVCGRAF